MVLTDNVWSAREHLGCNIVQTERLSLLPPGSRSRHWKVACILLRSMTQGVSE